MREKPVEEKPPYNRKEEIIHAGKRYRLHNNYLTIGGGYASSTIRGRSQQAAGADFHFHIRRHYFQTGVLMSGNEFLSNNHIQGHLGYGIRREKKYTNLAAFGGPVFYTGIRGDQTGAPELYDGVGGYVAVQAITKFTYDIGLGIEIFDEFSAEQNMFGFRIIAFFSGAYRGEKKNFNPNVRSEQ